MQTLDLLSSRLILELQELCSDVRSLHSQPDGKMSRGSNNLGPMAPKLVNYSRILTQVMILSAPMFKSNAVALT